MNNIIVAMELINMVLFTVASEETLGQHIAKLCYSLPQSSIID